MTRPSLSRIATVVLLVFSLALAAEAPAAVPFQVRVLGGAGQRLKVIDGRVGESPESGRVESFDVTSDDFVLALTRTATAAKDRFLRTEIGERGANVTNPMYY